MTSKQFKTYCRIIDYIDTVDSDLAAMIRGLCVDMSLGSLKGKPGITFLMPVDKTFRQKIEKLAYSDDPAEATKANDMLNALIIKDVFKSPADWMAKKDDIPNSLLPSQHVDVESTTAKEVIFKSGAKAVLDTDFKDSSRKSNLAVWKLTGEIPVTTDKPAKLKYVNMNKGKGKIGGYAPGNLHTQSQRFKIAIAVENAYALCRLQSSDPTYQHRDAYVEHVLSLIHYILHVRNDRSLLIEKVLPMISLDKIDFYYLVEPHKISGTYILDDNLIAEWWLQKHTYVVQNKKLIEDIEHLLNNSGNTALVYSSRNMLLDKIAEIRQKIISDSSSRPRGVVDEIDVAYKELESSNTIGGAGPVYPASLANFYAGESGLKELQDELRFLAYGAFKRLESGPFDISSFNDLLNFIGEFLCAGTSEERSRVQKLLNKNSLRTLIAPTEKVNEIRIFTNSTMFMYIPLTCDEANSIRQKHSIHRPDPNNIVLFNTIKETYLRHKRLFSLSPQEPASMDIVSALRSLDVNKLDPMVRQALKDKFQ